MIGLLRGLAMAAGGAYLLRRWVGKALAPGRPPEALDSGPAQDELVQDPVCGVYLPSRQAVAEIVDGRKRHFCSTQCRSRFLAERRRNAS